MKNFFIKLNKLAEKKSTAVFMAGFFTSAALESFSDGRLWFGLAFTVIAATDIYYAKKMKDGDES